MELGVRLNLLCSRLDEVTPKLQGFLAAFQAAIVDAKEGLDNFLNTFLPAVETATVAHAARAQAEEAQVDLILDI